MISQSPFTIIAVITTFLCVCLFVYFFVLPKFRKEHNPTTKVRTDRGSIYYVDHTGIYIVNEFEEKKETGEITIQPTYLDGELAPTIPTFKKIELITLNRGKRFECWVRSEATCENCAKLSKDLQFLNDEKQRIEMRLFNLENNFQEQVREEKERLSNLYKQHSAIQKPSQG